MSLTDRRKRETKKEKEAVALLIDCPFCGQPAGAPCKSARGRQMLYPHQVRLMRVDMDAEAHQMQLRCEQGHRFSRSIPLPMPVNEFVDKLLKVECPICHSTEIFFR